MFLTILIENFALALISLLPSEKFAQYVLFALEPFYEWALNLGL